MVAERKSNGVTLITRLTSANDAVALPVNTSTRFIRMSVANRPFSTRRIWRCCVVTSARGLRFITTAE